MLWMNNKRREPALIVLLVLFMSLFPALFRPFLHGADTVGYYSWLRSAVIDHTLDVKDAFHHYSSEFGELRRENDINRKTANGYTHNQWAAGSSILWAPAFLMAHAGVKTARALGSSLSADGYSWPYPLAASLSTAVYGLISLLLTFFMARRLATTFPAGLAVIVVWLASPMVFYMYSHPLLAHLNDSFVNTLFVYVWWKTQDSYSLKGGAARGIIAGLATWVRSQNALLIIILGLEAFVDLFAALRRKRDVKPAFLRGLSTLSGFLLLFVPLMIFWQVIFGTPLANTYAASQQGRILDWRAPHIVMVLFSSNRGLFTWAPVTLPALLGLRWLYKANARLTLILGGMFLGQLYVVSSWFGWSGNVAFGPRFWVAQTIIFALGLAALINTFQIKKTVWVALGSVFIVWNFLLIAQYALGILPRHGRVDLRLMVRNQFMVIPENLPRIIKTFRNHAP